MGQRNGLALQKAVFLRLWRLGRHLPRLPVISGRPEVALAGAALAIVLPFTCFGGGAKPEIPEKVQSGSVAAAAERDAGTGINVSEEGYGRSGGLPDVLFEEKRGRTGEDSKTALQPDVKNPEGPQKEGDGGKIEAEEAEGNGAEPEQDESQGTAKKGGQDIPDSRSVELPVKDTAEQQSTLLAENSNAPTFSIRRAKPDTAKQPAKDVQQINVIGGSSKKQIRLFNTVAFRGPLKSLPKWERVLRENRRDPALKKKQVPAGPGGAGGGSSWLTLMKKAESASALEKLKMVNGFFNRWPYRLDIEIYGVTDFWATPQEFMARSGDCEDYAISKYFGLRELGFSPDDLRIVVLLDSIRGIGHAVLVVYLGDRAYVLDNVSDLVLTHDRYTHYRPQYSINENYRWAHIPVRPAARGGADGKP
ncbi:transglutaminase-like cysteine peptidase [Oleidesulfovibrio sp.]|uniref:transglutaminase-like cysteine peptidase n=1 Tax=Oleidesulfovibrio sp. TaxID=2909707 RepID=UPI003A89B9CB